MFKLTAKDYEAIEKALNQRGATEVVVKVEKGQLVLLQVEKKKIN